MSSMALRACVLIHLQGNKGRWVPLPELVTLTACPIERVQHVCQQLVDDSVAHLSFTACSPVYGIGVEGVKP